jgi:hypothetical protein
MLKLTRAGAVILPACPGFYSRPKTIDDLVNSLRARFRLAGIDNEVIKDGNDYVISDLHFPLYTHFSFKFHFLSDFYGGFYL